MILILQRCSATVSYTFGSIDIETYNPKIWSKSHFISVYDKEGILYNKYSSINIAKIALGFTVAFGAWDTLK